MLTHRNLLANAMHFGVCWPGSYEEGVAMGEGSDEREGAIASDPMRDIVGFPVEVRSRFEGTWCDGFEIAEVLTNLDRVLSSRVRRASDGQTLPGTFSADEVDRRDGGPR